MFSQRIHPLLIFSIYRYDAYNDEWIKIATVSGTFKAISNLKEDASYKFRVRGWYESNDRSYLGDGKVLEYDKDYRD